MLLAIFAKSMGLIHQMCFRSECFRNRMLDYVGDKQSVTYIGHHLVEVETQWDALHHKALRLPSSSSES